MQHCTVYYLSVWRPCDNVQFVKPHEVRASMSPSRHLQQRSAFRNPAHVLPDVESTVRDLVCVDAKHKLYKLSR